MKSLAFISILTLAGCAAPPLTAVQNKVPSTAAPVALAIVMNSANVIAPPGPYLSWEYILNPGDESRTVAFNIWESTDLLNWRLIGTTTNHQFNIQPAPADFFRLERFFPRAINSQPSTNNSLP